MNETTAALLEACRQVYERLDGLHDVDTIIGDGAVAYRERPYQGVGEDLATLRAALKGAGELVDA